MWLDEWDLREQGGAEKKFYTEAIFEAAKKHRFKLALVSPELHASSPGLLGGECHPDGLDLDRNTARLREVISLDPDLICTDFPDKVAQLISGSNA